MKFTSLILGAFLLARPAAASMGGLFDEVQAPPVAKRAPITKAVPHKDIAPSAKPALRPTATVPAPKAAPRSTATSAPPQKTPPPPPPPPPKLPTCSSRTAEVKLMISKLFDRDLFNVSWREDEPLVNKSASFTVMDVDGTVRIKMIDGSGKLVGVAPAQVCLRTETGRSHLEVSLQRSSLNFTANVLLWEADLNSKVDSVLQANLGSTKRMPLIVRPGSSPGKIHIADGIDGKQINSDFSPRVAR